MNALRRRRDLIRDPYTERYRSLIAESDHLVFVYPVWWHSMPAIMRGFIERTFVSGFAYSFKGKPEGSVLPEGLLRGKKVWCVYSLDAPGIVARLDPGWLSLKYSVFWYCGIRHIRRLYLPRVKRTTRDERVRWLNHLYREAAKVR